MQRKITEAVNVYNQRKEEYYKDLEDFLRIQTISSDSHYRDEIWKGADWIVKQLKSIGA